MDPLRSLSNVELAWVGFVSPHYPKGGDLELQPEYEEILLELQGDINSSNSKDDSSSEESLAGNSSPEDSSSGVE
jgi:hypothetical protein